MAKSHACSSPDHHVHDAAGFVTAVERACSERGLRLTDSRRLLYCGHLQQQDSLVCEFHCGGRKEFGVFPGKEKLIRHFRQFLYGHGGGICR